VAVVRRIRSVLVAACFVASAAAVPASLWVERSLPSLIEESTDVVVASVDDVVGPECGQKALATVLRSLKGVLKPGRIELPFVYNACSSSEPDELGRYRGWFTDGPGISFERGRHYLLLLEPTTSGASVYRPANTAFEVLRYPDPDLTYFELDGAGDPRVDEIASFVALTRLEKREARLAALAPLVRHERLRVRKLAVGALADFDWELSRPLLFEALRDKDESVREAAILQVRRSETPEATSELLAVLDREPSSNNRIWAMQALAARGAREIIPKLLSIYPAADVNLRFGILSALRALGDPSVFPPLVEHFGALEDTASREYLVLALGGLRTREVADWLAALIEDPEQHEVRAEAVRALAELRFEGYGETLMRAANGVCDAEGGMLAIDLVRAIEKLGTTADLLTVCRRYAHCTQSSIQRMIVDSLDQKGSPQAIPLLESLADRVSDQERKGYIRSIIERPRGPG
jgi:HEAT repeat protein